MVMTSALFWDVTRRLVVIASRCFGQRIGPIFEVLRLLALEEGTDTFSRNIGKQLLQDASLYPRRRQSSFHMVILM
jgi:hypothetical protein